MTLCEAERQIQQRWMTFTTEERLRTCGGMYEAEKAILERCAPEYFSRREALEFTFYHMHGMTIEECIHHVPDRVP